MDERMTLTEVHNRLQRMSVAIGLPNAGRRIKSDEVRWSEELRLLAAAVSAHITQPAQAVDVVDAVVEEACRAFYETHGESKWEKLLECWKEKHRSAMRNAFATTQATPNAHE